MSYTQAEHDGVTTNSDWAARRRRVRTEHNSDNMIQMLLLMNEYLVAAGGATCDVVTPMCLCFVAMFTTYFAVLTSYSASAGCS